MNKKELSYKLKTKTNFKLQDINLFLNSFIEVVEDTLKDGEDIKLMRFGSFRVVKRKARNGTNPQTLETIKIPAKKAVIFTASKFLKNHVNNIKTKKRP